MAAGAIAIHGDGLPPREKVGELVDGHLRSLCWTIDSKEPQTGKAHAIEVMVVVAEQLTCTLCRGIGTDRLIDLVGLGEWHLLVDPIHR